MGHSHYKKWTLISFVNEFAYENIITSFHVKIHKWDMVSLFPNVLTP